MQPFYRAVGYFLYGWATLVRLTVRYRIEGWEHVEQAKDAGSPVIFATWHGMTMMLVGFFLQKFQQMDQLMIMMPDSWQGDVSEQFVKKVGAQAYRMNVEGDETMKGARQFAQLVRLVKQGHDAYITPDGPKGPAYVIKPGVVYLAHKTGAVLLPVGAYTRYGYRLNRWDHYVFPFPLARVQVVIGEAEKMPAGVPLETVTESLTNSLHRVTARAMANYYAEDKYEAH